MATGAFREDLYYRLNGLTVTLPALRARQDFTLLVRQMLDQLCSDMKRPPLDGVHPGLMQAMRQHPWPGNLRQLHSLLRTVCALLDPDEHTLDWHHLPQDMAQDLRAEGARDLASDRPAPATVTGAQVDLPLSQAANLRRLSDLTIEQVVTATQGNMSEAARRLGISRNTLYRRLKQIRT